jgi:DNA-binding LacI/PurR family transcriptional regulator
MELLVEELAGRDGPTRRVVLAPKLVVRATTAAPSG